MKITKGFCLFSFPFTPWPNLALYFTLRIFLTVTMHVGATMKGDRGGARTPAYGECNSCFSLNCVVKVTKSTECRTSMDRWSR